MTVWHQQKRWVFFFSLGPLKGPFRTHVCERFPAQVSVKQLISSTSPPPPPPFQCPVSMCWVWTPVVIDFSDYPFCWIVRFLSHTVVVIWFLFHNTFDRIAMISQDSVIHLQLNENQIKSASLNKVGVAQILCELLNF